MGKQRHQKDRLYLIPSEYALSFGGYKSDKKKLPFQCLPFYCCGLTLLPFKTPVVVNDDGTGIIFDKEAILKWLQEYSQNPVTGKPLKRSDLVDLSFHRNSQNEFHCPITYKIFNEHSGIVANLKSGHVYSKEAIDEVCRKSNIWQDLLTGEKFSPRDLLTIQDPTQINQRSIEKFYFVRNKIDSEHFAADSDVNSLSRGTINAGGLAREIMEKSRQGGQSKRSHKQILGDAAIEASNSDDEATGRISTESKPGGTGGDAADTTTTTKRRKKSTLYTTSGQAASLTSTAVQKKLGLEYRELSDVEIRWAQYQYVKKAKLKSHVRLVTSLGVLSIELRSDLVPETCDNFLRHCKSGYYDNTIFHRLIPRFMIQGGDPEGTGQGGRCAFEGMEKFNDEIHPELRHDRRGILSMANSGLDTNKSQFFILFAAAPHLDDLHSVFGSVVGGLDTLDKMERLKVVKERPETPPRILSVQIFNDAFATAEEALEKKDSKGTKQDQSLKAKQSLDPKIEKLQNEKVKSKSFIDAIVS